MDKKRLALFRSPPEVIEQPRGRTCARARDHVTLVAEMNAPARDPARVNWSLPWAGRRPPLLQKRTLY